MSVLVETTVGDLVFDLYTEERPRSSLNFLKLCKIKYYNYCLFHSVRRNFIAQCGDPSGTGRGGESVYSFIYGAQAKYFDLETKPRIKHKTKGTISFVNNGNDKHGSQFFITMGEGLDFLDGKHTIFGKLAEGFDTLELINEAICDDNHKPYRDVRITHTIILYDPYDDPKGLEIPDRSPEPTQEQLESGLIGADEDVDDKGRSKDEIQKEIEDKELQIGTKILETVGDINEADEKPPENVLFVCKLNPITNAEDLKIIFSRFGKIESCEIIKDYKTGDSLCYGFVEFKEVEACEKAYFKMDNVLIDDRRIHVDFCQSVGKLKKRFKGLLQKNDKEEPPGNKEYELKDKKKKEKEKYSMLFDAEENTNGKPKKKESRDVVKEKPKKRHDSESEDERPVTKKSSEKKSKNSLKEVPKRRRSSSISQSDDEPVKDSKPKRKSDPVTKDKALVKKRIKKDKAMESDLSSDEEHIKKTKKKKLEHKKIDKIEEVKKLNKKEKKYRHSDDSDAEVEKDYKIKSKRRKSESVSDDADQKIRLKKAKKEKLQEKKKKRKNESDDEHVVKTSKGSKQKGNLKKVKSNKTKSKSVDDSDSDDYDGGVTTMAPGQTRDHEEDPGRVKGNDSPRRRKHSDPSSDESSEDEDLPKKHSKVSKSSRHQDSSEDDRKKRSRKKVVQKKKVRKRYESSDSDSSD